ncbi:MAG: DUF192 domain-containing protein [Oligoflexia bacterium]|nr:DUF192 domain-containing protein [Oligoflexia bacterium]
MPKLFKKEENFFVADIIPAKSLKQRVQGLVSYSHLKDKTAFWITACPSVHTFFMKFPIDVIFTDRQFKIVALFQEVKAGKILFGGFRSRNVFEMKAGQVEFCQLKKGDILYVES